ncbi:ABC transporter substrate-binding protein [Microbacterium esteraromaticum]|uniref:ABC transporter substrate-binding protein n=2 Tax=Microbacterium esteraromaticum TaxID=57043 RepID=A0A939DTM3_9MICO|nr:ABC transporter substrate-binding protein [Microbacterium esteraromaticum]MBN8204955.1 ABC transporter substrate-binding protein [Microbacterium esteraromaticum]MBN8415109.1 ABC transporter substrate-binding protein [Microbacterium esteraromaticum]
MGLGAVAAVAAGLVACSPATTPESIAGADSSGAFPVTIEHVYGETTINSAPARVATVAWSNHEVPLALGIVPVGMSKATWGDDDGDGVLPWVEDELAELGVDTSLIGDEQAAAAGEVPVLFDETDGIDYEAVADTNPDVILAAYSGLTQEEYDTLSKIAPVVAYPEVAWATPLDQMIEMNSAALGLAAEGDALIDDLQAQITTALDANSALKDSRVLFSYLDMNDLSQIGVYTSHDTRPGFLEGIGLPTPAIVEEVTEGTDGFYVTVSAEQAERFNDVDVFVSYGDDSTIATLQADPLLSKIPAVAAGNIAILQDSTPLAASANPSPLSIGWGIDEYFALLADAVAGE